MGVVVAGGSLFHLPAGHVAGPQAGAGIFENFLGLVVVLCRSAERMHRLSDVRAGPAAGAGEQVAPVRLNNGLLAAYVLERLGLVGRDCAGQLHPLCDPGGQGPFGPVAERPGLAALLVLGPAEPVGRLGQVRGDHEDMALGPGPAHGHIGKLASSSVLQHVSHVDGEFLLMAVLFIAAAGLTEASGRFSQAGKGAEVRRLRLEDYGSVVHQTIRRAA
jgi:hypothetical protein